MRLFTHRSQPSVIGLILLYLFKVFALLRGIEVDKLDFVLHCLVRQIYEGIRFHNSIIFYESRNASVDTAMLPKRLIESILCYIFTPKVDIFKPTKKINYNLKYSHSFRGV